MAPIVTSKNVPIDAGRRTEPGSNQQTKRSEIVPFQNEVALVTGSGSGISEATANWVFAHASQRDDAEFELVVGDSLRENHDIAVLRLAHVGAVANTTMAMMGEWFRDFKSPRAAAALELFVPYREEWAALVRAPEQLEVVALESEQ